MFGVVFASELACVVSLSVFVVSLSGINQILGLGTEDVYGV